MRYMTSVSALLLSLMALSCIVEVKGIPEQMELTGCPPFTQRLETTDAGLTDAESDSGCFCQSGDPMCDCL